MNLFIVLPELEIVRSKLISNKKFYNLYEKVENIRKILTISDVDCLLKCLIVAGKSDR